MRLFSSEDELDLHTCTQSAERQLMSTIRRFKDSVHDYMPFWPEICAIIDTPQFQRLRNIKQLGTCYYVWPGASHNRFEHSLGVAFLSQQMVEHLQRSQPELGITRRDVKCVTMAGLCHDLGHGPWSHVWDGMFIPRAMPNTSWRHEDASDMMFDDLVEQNEIEIDEKEVEFIKALIAGDPSRCRDGNNEKPFLFQIVANKLNGLDVDKFDYIARDTRAIDMTVNMSLTRLIHSARVINGQICYDIKDANQIYELCYTRFSLHKRIYNHKTAKAIEYMIVDALLAAEPHMNFAQDIFHPKKLLHLTDDLKARIERTEEPELAEARTILHRVNTRDLYRRVDYKVFPWSQRTICREHFTPERIVRAAKTLSASGGSVSQQNADPADVEELNASHVIVDMAEMHYGMKDQNPLDSVMFYSKHHPDKSMKAHLDEISLLMPESFGEVLLRIYTREARFFGLIQAGYCALLAEIPEPLRPDPPFHTEHRALTPPTTEGPTTPRAASLSLSSIPGTSSRVSGEGTGGKGVTPLSQNKFMAVPPNFRPVSPTQEHKKRRSQKRDREGTVQSSRKKRAT
ncbi:hypothetical protein AcW1_004083 [Taiwanofungus camphoratus]|nr:hypothetical protein AcW2_006913 [Antrodia cinnamomea]KAI0938890.1 hypothetical protein AcV5_000462 [Antrodia cinnamomea]KAI0959178.1 hypothetical protein AcW1_004083 [Antrodia cinnamomea]